MLDIRYYDYQPGDYIELACEKGAELLIQFDHTLAPSLVVLPEGSFCFPIPLPENRAAYGREAFSGESHFAWARRLDEAERHNYVNLCLNSHDLEGSCTIFPHASTNSGATDLRFLARNAIDGCFQTIHHGRYPYQSWGTNGKDNAQLRIDFGRPVKVALFRFWLRADFPHDTYWSQARLELSCGQTFELAFRKTIYQQDIRLDEPQTIEWFTFTPLAKGEPTIPFAALSQVEAWGYLCR